MREGEVRKMITEIVYRMIDRGSVVSNPSSDPLYLKLERLLVVATSLMEIENLTRVSAKDLQYIYDLEVERYDLATDLGIEFSL